jgi:miniconductance mechanosensitive channel
MLNFLFSSPNMKIDAIKKWLFDNFAIRGEIADWMRLIILLMGLVVVWSLLVYIAKRIIVSVAVRYHKRTKSEWDDAFLQNGVFERIAHLLPAILMDATSPLILADFPKIQTRVDSLITAYVIGVFISLFNAGLNALKYMLNHNPAFRDKPVNSYIQLSKIIVYFVGGILIVSEVLGKNPLYFLTAMGAASAVLLLIFKDSILGFVASIQLSANDMVHVGDWVTMEKYGADGDVVEINLASIKVQNFDLTITTIPTYAFISDSFKNWRGMQESAGRRIKRAIKINKNSVKFCTPEMLERFKQIDLVRPYIEEKQKELQEYNETVGANRELEINGRNMTNVGIFRKYIDLDLYNNPHISKEMTCLTRQQPPTETGLPIEVYAFSNLKGFEEFEIVVADIFDHILAAVPYFDLSVFQNPSGADFHAVLNKP